MKKVISILLAALMILSACSVISYAESEDYGYVAAEADNVVTDDSYVAVMYLCSVWTSWCPHVFIYFENISDDEITVGKYKCPVGEGVSLGTFGMTVDDGSGLYYNLECYRNSSNNNLTVLNLSKKLTKSELEKVSNKICSSNHWDMLILNCCYFASSVWNAGGGSYVFPIVCIPSITRIQMIFKGCSSSLKLYKADRNQVYRQRGSGDSAYLELVSDSTL